jgi:hypothetical protein
VPEGLARELAAAGEQDRRPRLLPELDPRSADGPDRRWNNIDSVSKDRSYLIGFVWQEKNEEIHINLRGYPGVTKIPSCRNIELVGGKKHVTSVPCFADSRGEKTLGGFRVTTYTVNQDADQWHLLYAWRHGGTLYTLSEHIAPPYTLPRIVQNMNRMMGSLVLVPPR